MAYPTHTAGRYTVITLNGEVDLHYSPVARKQILDLVNDRHDVLVDLTQVKYIDSSGLASLVEGYQLARRNKVEFGLAGVSDAALQVLQLTRLDKVFPVYGSIEEAAQAAGRRTSVDGG
jgi:anti-sigma B factor antagonist